MLSLIRSRPANRGSSRASHRASKVLVSGIRARSRLFLVLVVVICGCSGEVEPPPADSAVQGPFARRFLPFDPAWVPLSTIPAEPQESPEMVIWEVSNFPAGAQPNAAQQAAADELVERCYEAALRNGWLDFDKALEDGYLALFQDRRHYGNWAFTNDGVVLDPDRPEFLMYYASPKGIQLIGFMFYTNELQARGPQIGGPLTNWHYHIWKTATCLRGNVLPIGQALESGRCLVGDASHRSPEMLHVWLLDRKEGPFSTGMHIPPERLGAMLAKRTKERGKPW